MDRARLNEAKKCLDGMRIEILNEIIDWINNTDPATLPIFWLYRQAGKGKLAIVHTIALQAQNLSMLGSCFFFSHVKQHEQLHMKLFPTIMCDLADCDIHLRPLSRTKHVWYSEHGTYYRFEFILERAMSVTHVAVILRTRTSPAYEEEFTKMDYPDARNEYGTS